MTNVFSDRHLLQALGATVFRGRVHEVAPVRVDDTCYDVLWVDGRPVLDVPFLDFLEPTVAPAIDAPRVSYLPAVACGVVRVGIWASQTSPALGPGMGVAPFVRWDPGEPFEAFVARCRQRSQRPFSPRDERARRKLEQRLGTLELAYHRPDHALLALCLDWKSEQYRRSGYVDRFASPRWRGFFHALLEGDLVRLSVLYAGEQPLAIAVGCEQRGRYYDWVPAYDRAFQAAAPGKHLREEVMRAVHARGLSEYDLLLGAESYKFHYATHVRLVGPAGWLPRSQRLWRPMRRAASRSLRAIPTLYTPAQRVMRRLRQARVATTGR